jgi:hypothetical protein
MLGWMCAALGGPCWGAVRRSRRGIPPFGLAVPLDCRAHNTPR